MSKLKLKPKQLMELGFPQNPSISMTMSVLEKHYKHAKYEDVEPILKGLIKTPEKYYNDELFGKIAERIQPQPEIEPERPELLAQPLHFNTFGAEHIEKEAVQQMKTAMRLPITFAGALMPDAHAGYGLPIGGVLATDNAVIPYGVGVDIGCRMCLSVFPIDGSEFGKRSKMLEKAIRENTIFGAGGGWGRSQEHEVLESSLFREIPLLRDMQGKAAKQLGTSGSGNHFVEFGIANFEKDDAGLGIKAGSYIALLTHSGSRGLGANIANYYTRVAINKRLLNGEAKNLAWLRLDEQEGMEYWLAMNLAGDYSAACHQTIHAKIAKAIDNQPIAVVENHHNFAWKEMIDGKEFIVHRKGATPAGKGVMGIIPGSMAAAGYIVRGKGEVTGINSAAHGAGRKMSRRRAKESVTHHAMRDMLEKHEITLISGGLDEAPHAYKDIEAVMQSQKALVDIVGTFQPRIVKMDEP
jgi:tRNA-splicing ligase RtcB (3'-phosphate/5'-hydroxy nucleic acid ligase)